jgi:hypothetical protein
MQTRTVIHLALLVGMMAPLRARADDWVNESGGGIPTDAVIAGTDNDGAPLYACRAAWGSGLHLGKMRAGWPGCDIPYGGREVSVPNYQVLAPSWVAASNGAIPEGAIQSGVDAGGQPLYICRDHFNANDLHPGKIRAGFPGCKIGYGGHEYDRLNYEVLVSRWAAGWKDSTGQQLPRANPDALIGGHEQDGTPLYLCRAHYQQIQPGKFRPGFESCKFPWAGGETDQSNYYGTLYWDSLSPTWQAASNGQVPPNAVAQGNDNDGTPFFACRAYVGSGLHPGKIRKDWRGCDVPHGGTEVTQSSYFVLVDE